MNEEGKKPIKPEGKIRTAIEEIVSSMEEEGLSHETAVRLAPAVIKEIIDEIEKEIEGKNAK